jgi:hypothetical protein
MSKLGLICQKVREVLSPYVHKSPYYNNPDLILYTNRALETLHVNSMFPEISGLCKYFPSVLEALFLSEKIDGKNYCSGQLVYLQRKTDKYIFKGDWGEVVLRDKLKSDVNIPNLEQFSSKFLDDITPCKFTTMLLNIKSDGGTSANLIMISKDSKGIIISLYCPSGNRDRSVCNFFLELFRSSLANKYKGKIIIKNNISIDCHDSGPVILSHNTCHLYHLLWIHVLIKTQESLSDVERRVFFKKFRSIQRRVAKFYGQKGLYNIVLALSSRVITNYLQNIR